MVAPAECMATPQSAEAESAGAQDNQQVVGEALEPVEFQEGEVIFRQVRPYLPGLAS